MTEDILDRLAKSKFRSSFRLSKKYRDYAAEKGAETIRRHAEDFIAARLAPAVIANDGHQTPMKNHPVFIASMPRRPAAAAALKNGTAFRGEQNLPRNSRNTPLT